MVLPPTLKARCRVRDRLLRAGDQEKDSPPHLVQGGAMWLVEGEQVGVDVCSSHERTVARVAESPVAPGRSLQLTATTTLNDLLDWNIYTDG